MDITYKEILGILSVILVIVGNYVYIKSIFQGKTKPHIYSKIVWTILMGIGFIIQLNDGGGPGTWMLGASAITEGFIGLLTIRYGTRDITKFDTILLILALVCIPIYLGIENKHYALFTIIFIDTLGSIPTFRKTMNAPFSEDLTAWNIFTLKNIFSILALKNYSTLTLLYPIVMTLLNIIFITGIIYKRKILQFNQKQLGK